MLQSIRLRSSLQGPAVSSFRLPPLLGDIGF